MPLSGVADLPLHSGHVPPWLARYMRRLAEAIVEAVVELFSPRVLVERLGDPFWFQAFNNAIGMDWDSSGSTTVTLGILKQVTWSRPELSLVVLGGKGRRARMVPDEALRAVELGIITDAEADEVVSASRLAAKTDNVLLDDGYALYHHAVVVSRGRWAIIQQGLNDSNRMARRYHWLSPLRANEPSLEPHSAIASSRRESVIAYDLTSSASREARRAIPELAASTSPRRLLEEIHTAIRYARGLASLDIWMRKDRQAMPQRSVRPRYYRPPPTPPRHIERVLYSLYEAKPSTIEELVMQEGVGPATLRSLVLVAELVYGIPVSHADPVSAPLDPFRYAYIVGGKDGVPFPFRKDYAEKVIEFLRDVVEEARLDPKSKRQVLRRLERLAGLLNQERAAGGRA